MEHGPNICSPPLSEICAIVGNKNWKKSNDEFVNTADTVLPVELLSVLTKELTIVDFDDDPDLGICSAISWSLLKNLPMFCFPNGSKLFSKDPGTSIEYGIFTDEAGSRLYMYCLCISRELMLQNGNTYFYVTKLCVFSSHKCYILMRDLFQTLKFHISINSSLEHEISNLLNVLSNVFVPPKGTVDVSFVYKNKNFTVFSPIVAGFCDVPLSLPFMFFSHEVIIEIIVAIISEQQIVFVSNDPANRVLIMECFLSSIFPLEWLAPYFPLLTENLYPMLDAMGYFIFGADRSVLEEDNDQRRIIFVDIDYGTVSYCEGAIRFNVDQTVIARFKERLPGTAFNFLCSTINKVFDHESKLLEEKSQFDFFLNLRVFLAMQYVLIDIYKGLLTFQMSAKKKVSLITKAEFPSCQLSPLQNHLKHSMMRSSLRIKYKNPYLERQYFALLDILKKKPIEHVLNEIKSKRRHHKKVIFTTSMDDNLLALEQELAVSATASKTSSLLYLKALLLLKNEEPILAFLSIDRIFKAGVKDFPASEVMALLKKLENFPDLYREVMGQEFIKQAVWAPLTMELGQESVIKTSPDRNYNYLEFPELLLEIGVTRHHDTAKLIFKTLKSDSNVVLGQDAKNFCDIWRKLKKFLDRRIQLPIITENKEKFVKSSEQFMDLDTGTYLVASIHKLYFVDKVTHQVCDLMKIDEITNIKLLTPSQISFQLKSREPMQIGNVKHAARWYVILEELMAATYLFKKTKDHTVLVDARSGIIIFDSLYKYEQKFGEMLETGQAVEGEVSCSTFFHTEDRHVDFLTFRKSFSQFKFNRSISTMTNSFGAEYILSRFSPNPRIKESIEVVVTGNEHLYIGTRTCSLHKVSLKSFDVEQYISMMLPDNENWTLYDILIIDDNLWIAVKYKSMSRSLHIMKCDSFDNYQTLPLFNHNDHIIGMRKTESECFITSMDGLTSIWSIEAKNVTRTIQDNHHYIFTTQISDKSLFQSVKNGFSVYNIDSSEFTLQETGFTLSKFIVCPDLGHIYGIDKASPEIIRCFSSFSFTHLEDLDISNTVEEAEQNSSFYNLVLFGSTYLVLSTRNCSLLVYNLLEHEFERCVLKAHSDLISCMTITEDGKIISGSRSLDGTVTVWVDLFDALEVESDVEE